MTARWAVNMSDPTGAKRSQWRKHVECMHSKLTPCFRLSLAWSATSDTITKAAATQTETEREKERDLCTSGFNKDTQWLLLNNYGLIQVEQLHCVCVSMCLWLLKRRHCRGYEYHRAPFCRFTLCVLVFFRIRREVVQVIWRRWENKDMALKLMLNNNNGANLLTSCEVQLVNYTRLIHNNMLKVQSALASVNLKVSVCHF